MTFQNSNGNNLYWLPTLTNKQLHAWCLENGINLPKRSRKDVFVDALKQAMADAGIDIKNHPDFQRATSSSSGCFTYDADGIKNHYYVGARWKEAELRVK
tara:strand:+ start:6445 stop:6744 length:300 start_codon:yes stop_codon:yes gene_type:complete